LGRVAAVGVSAASLVRAAAFAPVETRVMAQRSFPTARVAAVGASAASLLVQVAAYKGYVAVAVDTMARID
jgi:hypothetical protein